MITGVPHEASVGNRLGFLGRTLRAQLGQFPVLVWLGLAGMTLAALCMAVAGVHGIEIPPEGDLADTATFDGALGFFILTLALLAPGVTWTRGGRRIWVALLVVFTVYSYGIETIQAFRGLDPRFSRAASPLDGMAGGVFFLVAVGIMGCFTVLVVKYFRTAATALVMAVRYGALASFIAFFVGIWMSIVTQGRHVPEAGNLLVLHAAGFHGLQAVPLIALLHWWGQTPASVARREVHVAGLAWLAMCLAIGWQSSAGRALEELSPATAIAALCFVGVLIAASRAVAAFWIANRLATTTSN